MVVVVVVVVVVVIITVVYCMDLLPSGGAGSRLSLSHLIT